MRDRLAFNRGVIRPIECFSEGWQLIKDDYWLFLGITFVGILIAGLVPFYILMGPMHCGIFICLFRQQQARRPKFEGLFDGFNYFAESLIATMVVMAPLVIVAIVLYVLLVIGMVALLNQGGGDPALVFLALGGIYLTIFLLVFVVLSLTIFAYPLIVDRELKGVQAVTLSVRAVLGNLGGMIGLMLLEVILAVAGFLCCFVGIYFVVPISFAVISVAYRQVFPEEDRMDLLRDDLAPEDEDDDRDDTRIRAKSKPRRSGDTRVEE